MNSKKGGDQMLSGVLNQTCTMWPRLPPDEFSPGGWGPPVHIDVRWQEKQQLIRTADGQERMSGAVVYTMTPIALGSRLHLGETDEVDPANVRSFEPMAYEQMVDLDGDTQGWKVYV